MYPPQFGEGGQWDQLLLALMMQSAPGVLQPAPLVQDGATALLWLKFIKALESQVHVSRNLL
jgi:hypothetical protein